MFSEALADAETWRHSDDWPVWEMRTNVYARSGQQEQARRALAKLEESNRRRDPHPTAEIVMAYVALDKKDEAFACLQKALLEHSSPLTALKVEPAFDPLRSDPNFQVLLRHVGLEQ